VGQIALMFSSRTLRPWRLSAAVRTAGAKLRRIEHLSHSARALKGRAPFEGESMASPAAPTRHAAYIAASLLLVGVAGSATVARADFPGRPSAVTQDAVKHAAEGAARSVAGEPSRGRFGHADLYVPSFFRSLGGAYDLVVHFHGIASLQEENFERAHINAVVVSVNLGVASDAYANAFRAPGSFDALLKQAQRALDETGRAPGARLGRLALSAWSAGFASVGSILRQPGVAERVDAVLLADGPHANYIAPHRVNDGALERWAHIADAAIRGEKLFALTHSSIPTTGYPSTTETVAELLKLESVEKVPTQAAGPRGMRAIYESHCGDFHVEGFEGQTAKDHIDHIKGMSDTLLPYLRERWDR
jgi:hypothetical protein